MNNKNITVVIRCFTYNHQLFIRKCLDGIVNQKTNFKYVAIIHDDASTDNTKSIIIEYANKYPDIIIPIFEKENLYSKHDGSLHIIMNNACKNTGAKYIALCEGDDYWTDIFKLQKQVDFLENNLEYSVTFHRCKHINVVDGTEEDDSCGFLFSNEEEGIDINVDMFFEHWITQPLTMVCRSSMFDFELPYKYKYYRDMQEIYHLLRIGKGYLFGFYGGIRVKHLGGVASLISTKQYCETSLPVDEEFYRYNKQEYGAKKTYLDTLQSSVFVYAKSRKLFALKCAFRHMIISHYYKDFFRNVKYIIFS